jgi:hypothetical protein
MRSMILWVVTLCNSDTPQHYGGKYHLQLKGQRISQARHQQKYAYSLTLKMEVMCSSETLTYL